ncbi:MAG: amino acid--tRNA ligase-related protein [bacterium]|nr:amino acid--tRNA ligase-related protein [bacterium]
MKNKLSTALLEAQVFKSGREYLEREGFVEIFPPRVVRASGACENVNTLFEVSSNKDFKWFGHPGKHQAYLAQTGQLYLEAFVPYLSKVYCVGPSFRAEPGSDDRHLTEFQMMEIEFAGDFNKLLHYIESFVYSIAHEILKLPIEKQKQMGLSELDVSRLAKVKPVFPKITYTEAIKKLGLNWGDDINSKKEAELVRMFDEHPIFITRYPDPLWDHKKDIEVEKFFNMLPDKTTPGLVLSADLILPGAGEAVGSAARVDDPETLVYRLTNSKMYKRLLEMGGSIDDFAWYIEKSKEKMVPHAGCGFGMSRILKWIGAKDDIKKAVTFASNQHRII